MSKFRNFIMKWLGWIVIVPTIYLIFVGESEMWIVLILCLFKMPPFDWVGRYKAWLERKMKVEERGEKLRKWKEKQPFWIKVLVTIGVLLLLFAWFLFAPECELC